MKTQVIPTYYHGNMFATRLLARWAVFFDACGASWEYQPETFHLSGGKEYTPHFAIYPDAGQTLDKVYVNVYRDSSSAMAALVNEFVHSPQRNGAHGCQNVVHPLYIVGDLPSSNWDRDMQALACSDVTHLPYYNFILINGEYNEAYPCICRHGFGLVDLDGLRMEDVDSIATSIAFATARSYSFDDQYEIARQVPWRCRNLGYGGQYGG